MAESFFFTRTGLVTAILCRFTFLLGGGVCTTTIAFHSNNLVAWYYHMKVFGWSILAYFIMGELIFLWEVPHFHYFVDLFRSYFWSGFPSTFTVFPPMRWVSILLDMVTPKYPFLSVVYSLCWPIPSIGRTCSFLFCRSVTVLVGYILQTACLYMLHNL